MAEPAYPLTFPDREDEGSWPEQGHWTYEDYLRLPEDGRRYEVIRGHLYVTPAPSFPHQFVVWRFSAQITSVIDAGKLGVLLYAPFDVKLPERIASPVQPDLVFFRTGNGPGWEDSNVEAVPDLVVEVLSPSTRRIDQTIKFEAYQDAGIPEYWQVDPIARWVVVYSLNGRRYAELDRGGPGETVHSAVLPGFRLAVDDLFPAS